MIFDSNRKLPVVDLTSAWKGVNHHYFFYKSSHTSLSLDSSISIIKETSEYPFPLAGHYYYYTKEHYKNKGLSKKKKYVFCVVS